MSVKINKSNETYELGMMPIHYPADRVYLDGDVNKSVQDFKENFTTLKTSYRDSDGITFTGDYIEFGRGVMLSAVLSLYVTVNNTVLINPTKLPVPRHNVCLPIFNSSSQNVGYVLITNGDMYLCQTLSAGTYYINGSYIE